MLLLGVGVHSSSQNTFPDSTKTELGKASETIAPPTQFNVPKKPTENVSAKSFHTPNEMELTIYYLIFGFTVLLITAFLLHKSSIDSHTTFKYFIIVLLILSMLLLIATGLNNDQIAPAVGLFGTIAGYLLGKTDFNPTSSTKIGSSPEKTIP